MLMHTHTHVHEHTHEDTYTHTGKNVHPLETHHSRNPLVYIAVFNGEIRVRRQGGGGILNLTDTV